ncbi:hypothetical protein KKG41_05115 [Patescibacteria group bacterium]|nr:hypothetical protein [Patescibacteria group bacterium]MBU1890294.1 hypothetical protein [Patescibacteria group bacterium]
MNLSELQKKVMELANEKNWGTKPDDVIFAEKLALLHQEVSEALEAYRAGRLTGKDGVQEELADIILRTLHLAGVYNIDLEKEILKKIKLNYDRDWSNDQLYKDRDLRNKNKPR